MLTTIVAAIIVLGGLIFFHELGHFAVARWLGMGVSTFSLGFGPKLLKYRHGKTEYALSLVPLGGYVALVGENDENDIPSGFTREECFSLRPAWQRFLVIAAGPFANIAIGQSSVIADRIGLKLNEYHVTESGFGADIGYEKFWNLKCHYSGLTPDAAVVVATVRALKSHGGAPVPVPGRPLPEEYRTENVGFVEAGCCNLLHHIKTVKRSGVSPVVCINAFVTDTKAEIAKVRELCEAAGARVALSTHWEHGGEGALELADAVMDACNDKTEFKPLYSWDMPFKERIELVAREVYGADGVDFSAEASRKLADIQKRDDANELGLCMVKTHLSLSDDPGVKGAPKGWKLRIRDVLTFGGAGFVVPVSGSITLMPGTGSNPSFRRVDVDVDTGRVKGIF